MEGGGELPSGFPGTARPAPARPVVSGNKGTKKKKKGGRVTPPKGGSPAICQNGRPRRPDQWRI